MQGHSRNSAYSQPSTNQPSPNSSFRKNQRKNGSDFHGSVGSTSSSSLTTKSSTRSSAITRNSLLAYKTTSNKNGSIDNNGKEIVEKKTFLSSLSFGPKSKTRFYFTLFIPGILLGFTYFYSISHHFHSITNFSTLTYLEKELSLPEHTAFRYSFFKRISQEETFIQGIRNIVSDNRTTNWTNSFKKYSLSPEVVLGGGFHLFQKLLQDFRINLDSCWKGKSLGESSPDDWKCPGLNDSLNFYINGYWVIESCFVAFLYTTGTILSDSFIGGILAALTFILNHPQLNDLERMFPDGDKIGSYLAIVQLSLVPHFLFTKSHPSWTNVGKMFISSVVKIGISTGVLILAWEKEAQWILSIQLVVTLLIHFANLLSPYRLYIVMGSHIVGWEYATLINFDTTFHWWSFYIYLLLACLLCVIIMEPVVDKCFGDKLDKWMLIRAIMLTIALHIFFTQIRSRIGLVVNEDSRMSLYLDSEKNNENSSSLHSKSTFGVMALERRKFDMPWLKTIEPKSEEDLWERRTRLDSEEDSWDIGDSKQKDLSTGFSSNDQSSEFEPPVSLESIPISNEMTEDLMSIEMNIDSNEKMYNEEVDLDASKLENIFKVLRQCSQSKSIISLLQLLKDNAFPFTFVLFSLFSYPFTQKWFLKKNKNWIKNIDQDDYFDEETIIKVSKMTYLYSTSLALIFLTTRIHQKYYLILLSQLSLIFAFTADYKNFIWIYKRLFPGREKSYHIILLVLVISVMTGLAKLRLDNLYVSPQQGDSDLGESVELVQWMKENSNQVSSGRVFGSKRTSIKLFTSADISFIDLSLESSLKRQVSQQDFKLLDKVTHLLCKQSVPSSTFTLHRELLKLNITHLVLTSEVCLIESLPFLILEDTSPIMRLTSSPQVNDKERSNDIKPLQPLSSIRRSRLKTKAVLDVEIKALKKEESACDVKNILCNHLEEAEQKKESLCFQLLLNNDDDITPFRKVFRNRIFTVLAL